MQNSVSDELNLFYETEDYISSMIINQSLEMNFSINYKTFIGYIKKYLDLLSASWKKMHSIKQRQFLCENNICLILTSPT